MNTTKHTPTPWETCDAYGPVPNGQNVKASADDKMICSTTGYYGRAGAIANAGFIVKACNAHELLVEALQDARELLALNGITADDTADYGSGRADEVIGRIDAALIMARMG